MEDRAFAGVYSKHAMLTPSLCVLGASRPLLTCLFVSISVCCRMRMRICQWNLDIRSCSTVMRSEQPLQKLQSSCCSQKKEREQSWDEALKTLMTEISAAVMTALSEFIDKIDQNLPITAELVGCSLHQTQTSTGGGQHTAARTQSPATFQKAKASRIQIV